MAKDPAYPLYAQDFDMDTAAWSCNAVGAYIRLLNYSWINGPLPDDIDELARISRLDGGNFKKVWSKWLGGKFKNDGMGFVNRRLEEERQKRNDYVMLQRNKGLKSAEKKRTTVITTVEPRYQPKGEPKGEPNVNSSFSSSLKDISKISSYLQNSEKSFAPEGEQEDHEELYKKPKREHPPCPHQEIITLYHKHLPTCSEIVKWTDTRAKHLRARWNEDPERQSLEWWEDLFKQIAESKFLTGRKSGKDGRVFFANLDWIVKSENMTKILEGRYH